MNNDLGRRGGCTWVFIPLSIMALALFGCGKPQPATPASDAQVIQATVVRQCGLAVSLEYIASVMGSKPVDTGAVASRICANPPK